MPIGFYRPRVTNPISSGIIVLPVKLVFFLHEGRELLLLLTYSRLASLALYLVGSFLSWTFLNGSSFSCNLLNRVISINGRFQWTRCLNSLSCPFSYISHISATVSNTYFTRLSHEVSRPFIFQSPKIFIRKISGNPVYHQSKE